MASFLSRVEALYKAEADVRLALKPIVINKPKQNINKKLSPKAPSVKEKASESEVQKAAKVNFSELTNTRKLIPFIKDKLNLTDPFHFTNDTWARFLKDISPKLLTALLLDMNIVPKSRRAEFVRYLERKLRTLART